MIAALDHGPDSIEPRSLFAILALRARTASDAVLATLTALGGMTIVALAAMQPRWWMYALAPVVVGAFGLWGILERAIAEHDGERGARYDRVVGYAQALCIAIGSLCALVSAFALLGIFMGPYNN